MLDFDESKRFNLNQAKSRLIPDFFDTIQDLIDFDQSFYPLNDQINSKLIIQNKAYNNSRYQITQRSNGV